LLLSVPFSSVQFADFCNCLIDLVKPFAALFEHRRKFGGDEGRVVRSFKNHAAKDRCETSWGAVLGYQFGQKMFSMNRSNRYARPRTRPSTSTTVAVCVYGWHPNGAIFSAE
jgi:hypothetical protein